MQPKIKFLPQLALLSAALIWGISFVIIKNTLDVIPPNFLLAVRFTIATLVLAAVFHKKLRLIRKKTVIRCCSAGVCLFLAYMTQTIGITDTTPGKNAFLTAVYCVIVPFLYWLVGGKKPTLWNIGAAVLCLVGIGMVSLTEGFTMRMGDALTLVGGVFYAIHIVLLAKTCAEFDPGICTMLQFAAAAVCAWAVTACTETPPALGVFFTADGLLSIGYLAFLASAACMFFQTYGLKYASPNTGSILLSLESVFGVLFSLLVGGESMTLSLGIGFALIFIAVIASETQFSFLGRKSRALEEKK